MAKNAPKNKRLTVGELAKLAGVSQPAVTQAMRKGRALEGARGKDGKFDPSDARVVLYLKKKETRRRGKLPKKPAPATGTLEELPREIRDLAELSLRELAERFGHAVEFNEWLRSVEKIERISQIRISNQMKEGAIIPRDAVKRFVLEPFDRAFRLLLSDGCRTISRQLSARIRAGEGEAEREEYVREQIAIFIHRAKRDALEGLEGV